MHHRAVLHFKTSIILQGNSFCFFASDGGVLTIREEKFSSENKGKLGALAQIGSTSP